MLNEQHEERVECDMVPSNVRPIYNVPILQNHWNKRFSSNHSKPHVQFFFNHFQCSHLAKPLEE